MPKQSPPKTITSQNLFYFLSASVSDIDRHSLKELNSRKKILKSLAKKILLKLLLKAYSLHKYSKLIKSAKNSRDLQIFQPQKSSTQFKPSKNQVFFSINECNCLGLKSNRYIKKTIFHDSEINKTNQLTENIRIIWEHLGEYDFPLSGTYHSYIRVFFNKNFQIKELDFFPEQSKLQGGNYGQLKFIDFNLNLKPKQKFILNLTLNRKQKTDNYNFCYFTQSGSQNEHLHKTISYPQTYRLSSSNSNIHIKENIATLDLSNISTNIQFNLEVTEKNTPPRIISHEILAHNSITIEFNTPPQHKFTKKHIKVLSKETIQPLEIKSVSLKDNILTINTADMPKTKEFFYIVKLKNPLYPKGRQITVVYRPQFFMK